jgi:hypothetical protein
MRVNTNEVANKTPMSTSFENHGSQFTICRNSIEKF